MEPRLLLAADLALLPLGGDELPPLEPPGDFHLPGSIAGSVLVAGSGPGSQSQAGIVGAKLELLDASGQVLAEAITDELGDYEFPALEPGEYAIRQWQPASFDDGHALLGDGGGRLVSSNLISQVVVHPGSMLGGYDFVETAIAFGGAAADEILGKAPPFVPPVVVEWSRPIPLAEPLRESAVLSAPLSLPPVQMRLAEPFIGGSSRAIDHAFAGDDAAWSRLAEEELSDIESHAGGAVDDSTERVLRRAARDIALELDVHGDEDDLTRTPATSGDSTEAEPPRSVAQLAAKPAA
jgi:hypothetical protein